MSRSKTSNPSDVEEQSPFPEGLVTDSWGTHGGREMEIEARRKRVLEERPHYATTPRHRGKLHFPVELIPEGWQYCFAMERLLNEDKSDNLEDMLDNGWDFVLKSEHPELEIRHRKINRGGDDGYIRKGGQILMKKRKDDWEESQESYRMDGEEIRKQSTYLTDYYGSTPQHPKFVVENSGNYTPNYVHKRG